MAKLGSLVGFHWAGCSPWGPQVPGDGDAMVTHGAMKTTRVIGDIYYPVMGGL